MTALFKTSRHAEINRTEQERAWISPSRQNDELLFKKLSGSAAQTEGQSNATTLRMKALMHCQSAVLIN